MEQCGIAWHGTVGQYGKIVKQYCGTGEQCETIMVGEWNSVGSVKQCGGTLKQYGRIVNSMVEQKKSVMEQCEQSGIVCWNSGTVYDGTVEQCEQCRTVWCC